MRVTTLALIAIGAPHSVLAQAAQPPGESPILYGVYQVITSDATTADGHRNAGGPAMIPLLPAAVEQMGAVDLARDPVKLCQPIGPFRMMAREQNKIEIMPLDGTLVMIFEDLSHGLMRAIHTDRGHLMDAEPTWLGDSVGRWEADTLVVDTTGFNDRTWLNAIGAQHSDQLHLIERIRPVASGAYLEYTVTAEDAGALASPYTYTRFYERVDGEMSEDVCAYEWPD
jgi:hypothetical protein